MLSAILTFLDMETGSASKIKLYESRNLTGFPGWVETRVVLGGDKSQIVHAPLREFWVSVGKPDWIVFSLKSPIGGRAKFFNKKILFVTINFIFQTRTMKIQWAILGRKLSNLVFRH